MFDKKVIFSILIIIAILSGCKCKQNDEKNYKIVDGKKIYIKEQSEFLNDKFQLKKGSDIFAMITSRNYINSADILKIIGDRIGAKGSEKESNYDFKVTKATRIIVDAKIDLFNAKYRIKECNNDSLLYNVYVKKPFLKGGSIFQILTDLGMNPSYIGLYAWKMGEYVDPTSMDVGDTLIVEYNIDKEKNRNFVKFAYKNDKISTHEFYTSGDKNVRYNLVQKPFELRNCYYAGDISRKYNSMDRSMAHLKIPSFVRQQANDAIDCQLSLQSDARPGDKFEILVQEKWINGEKQPKGKLLYVQYSGKRTGTRNAYRFQDKKDDSAYNTLYTKRGKRLVQGNIRTPLDNMHITSPFGYRIHPILNRRIKHHGMDLRGRTGTPIYAVADGRVIKAANIRDGYGNDVRIRHENGMITQYAHCSRILVRKGQWVKKGKIIARVGSTGRSTGPHLHFGVKLAGRWVNPKTNLKMVAANKLSGNRKNRFFSQVTKINQSLKEQKSVFVEKERLKNSVVIPYKWGIIPETIN